MHIPVYNVRKAFTLFNVKKAYPLEQCQKSISPGAMSEKHIPWSTVRKAYPIMHSQKSISPDALIEKLLHLFNVRKFIKCTLDFKVSFLHYWNKLTLCYL